MRLAGSLADLPGVEFPEIVEEAFNEGRLVEISADVDDGLITSIGGLSGSFWVGPVGEGLLDRLAEVLIGAEFGPAGCAKQLPVEITEKGEDQPQPDPARWSVPTCSIHKGRCLPG